MAILQKAERRRRPSAGRRVFGLVLLMMLVGWSLAFNQLGSVATFRVFGGGTDSPLIVAPPHLGDQRYRTGFSQAALTLAHPDGTIGSAKKTRLVFFGFGRTTVFGPIGGMVHLGEVFPKYVDRPAWVGVFAVPTNTLIYLGGICSGGRVVPGPKKAPAKTYFAIIIDPKTGYQQLWVESSSSWTPRCAKS